MPEARITHVRAREVFDSRGNPTVEVEVACGGSRPGRAIVPRGASTGRFEAVELRDGNAARLAGRGVMQAVSNVNNEIARAVTGMDATDQRAIDRRLCELDGTDNKSRLGANAVLGVSLAAAYAAAESRNVTMVEHLRSVWRQLPAASTSQPRGWATLDGNLSLPLPMVNMISGGLHAGGNLDFQDFLIMPVGAASLRQAVEWAIAIYHRLGGILKDAGCEGSLVGDEGGYGPRLETNSRAVELIVQAIEATGLRPREDVAIALDVASSHFYDNGRYRIAAGGDNPLTAGEMIDMLEAWVDRYPILSIEDALHEDDWDGWKRLTERLGHRVQLIGDDLFVTNRERLERGMAGGVANGILIKLNQVGTLWETLEAMRTAMDAGYWPVVSAHSGETEDTTIADLAVATGAGQIKIGSVARSERLCKYNQLLRLEEQFGNAAQFAGGALFARLQ